MAETTSKTSIDVLSFVVHEANGLKGLVDTGLNCVPHLYIQPEEERLNPNQISTHQSIPIIDVSNWDNPTVKDSIFEAATQLGFFQIINHGIPIEILENIKKSAHEFFDLSNEERKRYWKGQSQSETVFVATSFSPLTEKALEWKDYLSFNYISGDDSSPAFWPSVCKDEVLAYMKRAEPVIRKLLELLLKKLNVKDINKEKEHALMGSLRINMNYYPRCPNPELTVGVGRHSDISSITLLLQDDTGGLYVRGTDDKNTWIHVPPVNGALVVNIGDVLQIMSNDRYQSVEHRAVASGSRNRVSIPIFVSPAPDALVGPLSEVVESGEPCKYKHVVFSDYYNYFFSKGHDGKNTIDFARI